MRRLKKDDHFKTLSTLSFAWQLGFLVVVSVGGFLFLGYLADGFFGTAPIFLIGGVILGIVVTAFETYRLLMTLIGGQTDENKQSHEH